jgi:hypothetical protein
MRTLRNVIIILVAVFIAIQFVPAEQSNPPVTGEIEMADSVHAVIKRSCYDCHSNETEWPWYASVAPSSWLVTADVLEGREHLNFSEWQGYDLRKQAAMKEEIWEEVDKGKMPLDMYLWLHSEAELSENDEQIISQWSHTPLIVPPSDTAETTRILDPEEHEHEQDDSQ